jgi:hypothetical protein
MSLDVIVISIVVYLYMFTHEVYDDLGTIKRFRTHKEAKWFAEVNQLKIRSTGYKAPPPVDPYTTALAQCGECLL